MCLRLRNVDCAQPPTIGRLRQTSLSVNTYLRTTGNEVADEGFQRLEYSVRLKNNVAILLKRRHFRLRNQGGRAHAS